MDKIIYSHYCILLARYHFGLFCLLNSGFQTSQIKGNVDFCAQEMMLHDDSDDRNFKDNKSLTCPHFLYR